MVAADGLNEQKEPRTLVIISRVIEFVFIPDSDLAYKLAQHQQRIQQDKAGLGTQPERCEAAVAAPSWERRARKKSSSCPRPRTPQKLALANQFALLEQGELVEDEQETEHSTNAGDSDNPGGSVRAACATRRPSRPRTKRCKERTEEEARASEEECKETQDLKEKEKQHLRCRPATSSVEAEVFGGRQSRPQAAERRSPQEQCNETTERQAREALTAKRDAEFKAAEEVAEARKALDVAEARLLGLSAEILDLEEKAGLGSEDREERQAIAEEHHPFVG